MCPANAPRTRARGGIAGAGEVGASSREAMERGEFDNLPGAGKPIPDLDEPEDELAWVRRWMKREGIDLTRELAELTPEQRTRLLHDLRGR